MNFNSKKIFITGGAGFVGSNLANSLLIDQCDVTVIDNLSRKGVEKNIEWLKSLHGNNLKFVNIDITNFELIKEHLKEADLVFHLAAQVAVTTSVIDPRKDFDINLVGTLNILESIRLSSKKPILLFTSTNKVYGELQDIEVTEDDNRYSFKNIVGVSEQFTLDFHSPYGCSKGAADQYVRDYSRIYGIKTIVFRMSCIYGIRQFGNEDQGWLAHFIISMILSRKISIYGNGKQVRDLLYVDDLINAMKLAIENIENTSGKIYNIGGGSNNSLSIWRELSVVFKNLNLKIIDPEFSDWRPGDQPIYISDISKARKDFGWSPKISVNEGISKLLDWVKSNKNLFQ